MIFVQFSFKKLILYKECTDSIALCHKMIFQFLILNILLMIKMEDLLTPSIWKLKSKHLFWSAFVYRKTFPRNSIVC